MALEKYRRKRDFSRTPEPASRIGRPIKGADPEEPFFVVQEHHASRLHYDFRLEAEGVLKSWAIPKEPLQDPYVKRLAIETEDHPLEYGSFSGRIPEGEYGAGTVSIWDRGTYRNLMAKKRHPKTLAESMRNGHIEIFLKGKRMKGAFALVRTGEERGKAQWILVKMWDAYVRSSTARAA